MSEPLLAVLAYCHSGPCARNPEISKLAAPTISRRQCNHSPAPAPAARWIPGTSPGMTLAERVT